MQYRTFTTHQAAQAYIDEAILMGDCESGYVLCWRSGVYQARLWG